MTDTDRDTAVSQKMQPQDYITSLLLPGLGHIRHGWWSKAIVFWSLLAVQGGTLYLAILRGRLAWFAYSSSKSPSEYWFSTSVLFLLLCGVWVFALFDLRRSIRLRSEETYARGYWQIVSRRFSKDAKGILGLLIILFVLYVALFSPFYARGNALKMDLAHFLTAPSPEHPLGMDNFGRDVLDRLIFGSRVALGIGGMATLLNMLFGGFLGLIGGFFRGVSDAVIMRFLEIINSIPFLVLALLIISMWGSSIPTLIVVLGIFGLGPARIIRSEVLSVREEDYILAARAVGAPTGRIVLRHVLPNAIASLLVVSTMSIGVNIIVVAGLSFLGFGIRPPMPSWGAMLQQAQEFMRTAWWMAVYPGLCIIFTVFGFNILGDSLRDVLDPRLK
ncbi:ABC transporter permease [Candidatus Bipolaricaulota bacterium]|nr:ABC transporter permease [Candidatus Bipolaricaulota bacterium]HHR84908.1 ABC transporter permease [Candidatus Acetothermia bacterium]